MVLVPLVCSSVDVPVIAAGGICDGRTMAAAFALGAEGVQMGTRMVSAAESPVHDNYKGLIVDAGRDRHRVPEPLPQAELPGAGHALQRGTRADRGAGADGDARRPASTSTSAATSTPSFAFGGQVAGRIDEVKPVAEIIDETIAEFHETRAVARQARTHERAAARARRAARARGRPRGSRARTRGSCCATRAPTS